MTFGERLRFLREEKGVTQKDLGNIIGVSARMVSFYESGAHFPRDEHALIRLAAYFEVSTDYLLGCSDLRIEAPLKALCIGFKSLPPSAQHNLLDFMDYLVVRYRKPRL